MLKQIEIMTKIRNQHQADVQLSKIPFIIGAVIIVSVIILTIITA